MRGAVLGTAAAAAPAPGLGQESPEKPETPKGTAGDFDFSRASSALQADEVVASACQFCNSNCRIHVHKKRGRVLSLAGEAQDPVQAGGHCVKADLMTEILVSERRLRRPLKRVSGAKGHADTRLAEISWEEAYEAWAKRLLILREAGEGHSIVNRTTGRMLRGTGSIIERILRLLGSPNHSDVGPVCNDAGGDALAATFGLGLFSNGYGVDANTGKEDLGAARLMLLVGTNQAETHPVTFSYLLRARVETGAKMVVVDPR